MLFSRGREFAALAAWLTGLSALAFAEGAVTEPVRGATGRPALLNDAFNALLEDQGRWAYTETHTGVRDGKPLDESSFRVDPSAPYAEQNQPLKISGKPPTEKQLKEAADRGELAGKRRLEQQQKIPAAPVAEEKPKVHRADEVQLRVGGQNVTPQIDEAKVVKEDETSVTYEVPMHPEGRGDANAMLEKFELTARVNKRSHQFERATIRQRAPLRVKLIAKVSDTLLEYEFSTPDPRYPAVLTKFTVDSHVTLLFGKVHAMHHEGVRSELRHVTPYDERFGVKLGPMRTLEL
jgi:hypothetical protein